MRLAFLALAVAACSPTPSFAPYCTVLSTKPSTWEMIPAASGCSIDAGFPLRFDETTPQPCGPGCTCTLGAWAYGSVEQDLDFRTALQEWCNTGLDCSFADGGLAVFSTGPPAVAVLGGCTLTGTPQ